LSLDFTLGNACGNWRASRTPTTRPDRNAGSGFSRTGSARGNSPSIPPFPRWPLFSDPPREKLRTEAEYFEIDTGRMRYPKFRGQHLFAGSGVIEAGRKTVIGSHFKLAGMFWKVRGANAILALRCRQLNGRFEDYWEMRRAR